MLGWLLNLDFAGGGPIVEAGTAPTWLQWRHSRYQHGHHYKYARAKAWLISCLTFL